MKYVLGAAGAFALQTCSAASLTEEKNMDRSGSSRLRDNGILYRIVVLCAALSVKSRFFENWS